MTEEISYGKSNSFFFLSPDWKYLVKTISKKEKSVFKKILKDLFSYQMENPKTLLVRYYGFFKI